MTSRGVQATAHRWEGTWALFFCVSRAHRRGPFTEQEWNIMREGNDQAGNSGRGDLFYVRRFTRSGFSGHKDPSGPRCQVLLSPSHDAFHTCGQRLLQLSAQMCDMWWALLPQFSSSRRRDRPFVWLELRPSRARVKSNDSVTPSM